MAGLDPATPRQSLAWFAGRSPLAPVLAFGARHPESRTPAKTVGRLAASGTGYCWLGHRRDIRHSPPPRNSQSCPLPRRIPVRPPLTPFLSFATLFLPTSPIH